jgi:hypothetical protein
MGKWGRAFYCNCPYGRFKGIKFEKILNEVCENWKELYVIVNNKKKKKI